MACKVTLSRGQKGKKYTRKKDSKHDKSPLLLAHGSHSAGAARKTSLLVRDCALNSK